MRLPFSVQRVVILAPHPDDDVIAAGGLIQRVLAARGDVHVLFITDGENNPWPQRYLERKLFIGNADRAKWGSMRRAEALCSLASLGVPEGLATFLAFPDQGIAALARRRDLRLHDRLRDIVGQIQPTLIVSPSSFDMHSDHRAIAYYLHNAAPDSAITTYVIHGSAPADRLLCKIELTQCDLQRKREGVECHQSQLALSRERFLSYAGPSESFYSAEFDVVRVESAVREKLIGLRQGTRVLFGIYPRSGERASRPHSPSVSLGESSTK